MITRTMQLKAIVSYIIWAVPGIWWILNRDLILMTVLRLLGGVEQ